MSFSALFLTLSLWWGGAAASHTVPINPAHARRAGASPSSADSLSIRVGVEDSTRAFLRDWRLAWFSDFDAHKSGDYSIDERRNAHAHCHERSVPADEYAMLLDKQYEVIKGSLTAAGVCPSWELGRDFSPADESDSIDVALTPSKRLAVRAARGRLIDLLDAAQDSLPGDKWIVGQRVRFLVDQGRAGDALTASRNCHIDAWWCSALGGFVLAKQGEMASADSAFRLAGAALPLDLRCEWTDIRMLLTDSIRRAYATSPCEIRTEIAERYWWLADPLFSVRGNERRAEHYARRVMVLLHSALDLDERYHYAPAFGGDAVERMLMKYGWPTAGFWAGREEDRSHDAYLKDSHSLSAAPYSSAEYSSGRVHFAATWPAVSDPFHADANAWQLNAPDNLRTTRKGRGEFWWPSEHMRYSANAVAQYPAGQTAFFRRQTDVQVAAAVAIGMDNKNAPGVKELTTHDVNSALVVSSGPDVFDVITRGTEPSATRVALSAFIASKPALLSMETQSTEAHGAVARTRFSIAPPAPLDSLKAGTLAISDPVFFAPPANGDMPASVDSMLPHMLGTTTILKGEKIGIFWENYGVSATDSIKFSINATSISGRSFMQRLASALKISNDGVSNVAVSWVDARIDTREKTPRTRVSIVPRSVILDMAQLPKGTYSIEVQVTVAGREPARAGRILTVR